MDGVIGADYSNLHEQRLVSQFLDPTIKKKYILGINKFTKSVRHYIEVEGIIDDFTRVQRSRKKEIYQIEDVPKDALILWTAFGSPLSVKARLDDLGFTHFSYLALYKYGGLALLPPPFMEGFEADFTQNYQAYERVYTQLEDKQSKEIFIKLINFKRSFDYQFMQGFCNNHTEQYFDKALIPSIPQIVFVDGGGYVGDTLAEVIKQFPDFKKIYCIEPSRLHISIAQRAFSDRKNIVFIPCGLSDRDRNSTKQASSTTVCQHDYQAVNTQRIDAIVKEKVDFIKLDIEGSEQQAIEGAKETIRRDRPILAICIYHKAEDWYKVPQKVLALYSGYKVYLRHYMEGIYETVMYFIPEQHSRG